MKSAMSSAPSVKPDNPPAMRGQFENLAQRFDGFEQVLVMQRNKERVEDEKKFVELKEEMEKLQKQIKDETKKRIEVGKAMKDWFDDRLVELEKRITPPLQQQITKLETQFPPINKRIDRFHERLNEKTQDIPSMIDARASELLLQIQEFKSVFSAAQEERISKDDSLISQMEKQRNEYTTLVQSEREEREKKDHNLSKEISQEIVTSAKGVEILKMFTKQELAQIQSMIETEVKLREKHDEELAQAIQHFTAALQDNMKVLSTGQVVR